MVTITRKETAANKRSNKIVAIVILLVLPATFILYRNAAARRHPGHNGNTSIRSSGSYFPSLSLLSSNDSKPRKRKNRKKYIPPIIPVQPLTSLTNDTNTNNKNNKNNNNNDNDNDPYKLARTQSFGFFYDIPTNHWQQLQQIYYTHENHRYPDKPYTFNPEAMAEQSRPEIYAHKGEFDGWSSYPAWYQNNYEPNFSCQFEKRVGIPMNGDGPKWVCDPHRIKKLAQARKQKDPNHPGCVIYSIGSNGNFDFELGMQKEVGVGTCEFHIFDMGDYQHIIPSELKRAYYHQWGLKKRGVRAPNVLREYKLGDTDKFHSLHATMKQLGHDMLDVIDVFKIDCEKCEWETYQDWLSDDIPILHQILVEVHQAPINTATDFFDSLEDAGYLRFHKEPNIQWASSCIEYAFVKVDTAFMAGKHLERA